MVLYAALLAIAAMLFVFLEFFLPGGIMALIAILFALAGFILLGIFGQGWDVAIVYLSLCIALAILTSYLALKQLKRSGVKNSFFLSRDQQGYVAYKIEADMVGKKGKALSDLKPSGHVAVDDKSYQALSERGYITCGADVEVIGQRSSHLIVKQLNE